MNEPLRVEVVGTGAVFRNDGGKAVARQPTPSRGEYQLRAAVRSVDKAVAQHVADEVLSLFCSGPAGGGGYRCQVSDQVNTSSVLVNRNLVEAQTRAERVMP